MPTVPINDLKRHIATLEPEISEAIGRVLHSGRFLLGSEGSSFEREFADYCGAGYAVAVANGTDAIEIGLRAIGIGSGSQVATVANAGYYSSAALAAIGAEPVYIDIDPENYLMDLKSLERTLVNRKLDALIVTHLYGLLHDMETVTNIASDVGIPVFEDCSQAHGARRAGRKAGSFGAAAAFSFFPTKNLGALGDGGAVVCQNAVVAERAKCLRQYGWGSKYNVCTAGGRNSRLDELQAAVLRCKLPYLDAWNSRRRAIAQHYTANICHPRIQVPPIRGEDWVAHLYVVRCADRADLADHLLKAAIMTDVHYPVPDNRQPIRQDSNSGLDLVNTDRIGGEVLTLPCFPELTDSEIERVIAAVNGW